jgi:sugar/nucleoside kinase (ribokinase family)
MATLDFGKSPLRGPDDVDLCVVGNLTIDVIFRGIASMPAWGQEVIGDLRTETVGGQAGGMAFASAALGVRTDVVADVGEDAAGERIRRELAESSVGVDAVTTVQGGVTPMTVAIVRPDGERAFLSDLGRLRDVELDSVVRQWPDALSTAVVALVGTSNLPGVDYGAAARLLGQARQVGALTLFDPGWASDGWSGPTLEGIRTVLAETDLFLPNLDEARALTGHLDVTSVLRELAHLCRGVSIVKAGEAGSYVGVGEQIVLVEALTAEVDNAVGAGDVYNAGVVAGFLRGRDVPFSMALGTAAASHYVGRRIERFPTFDESAQLARQVTTSLV